MVSQHILSILQQVQDGAMDIHAAYEHLKISPFEDLGYAKIDHHRAIRQGTPEIVYGAGKTKEQIEGIVASLLSHSPFNILITRLSQESALYLEKRFSLTYDELSQVGIVNRKADLTASGTILVATGGTSDIPVAEEAALTAEVLGNKVERLYDVGVAGLHRLLSCGQDLWCQGDRGCSWNGRSPCQRYWRACRLSCDRSAYQRWVWR